MLWQLVQPTFALACGERSKSGCALEWHSKQVASISLAEALEGLKILVTSPPPSTCAFPAPWQFSQVAPLLPCIWVILVWGLSANFFDSASWQVAQTSPPTKSPGDVSLVCAV